MTEALQVLGCVAATSLGACAMLAADRGMRAAAMIGALAVAFLLLVGEAWDELEAAREHPALLAAAALIGAAVLVGLAAAIRRRPLTLPLLLVAALPFRVPVDVGGSGDANLLLPLYLVIAAGALAYAFDAWADPGPRRGADVRALAIALGAATVLYALQAAYSSDVGFATRNVGFFLVPFAVMFALLTEISWTPRVIGLSFAVLAAESILFAVVGVGQQLTEQIFWNPALERSNDFHFYFRVNSLFWDPNIYGRYLALAGVLGIAATLWIRDGRRLAIAAAGLAVLLAGLVLGFSQTSYVSLLVGAAVVFALGVSFRWTAVIAPVAAVAAIAAVFLIGGTSEAEDSSREISSGRTTLIEGGTDLFRSQPALGHGSASFSSSFAEQEGITNQKTTASHNEPVTVAAEQGALGLAVYAALVLVAAWALLSGMRGRAPGLRGPPLGDPWDGGGDALRVARIALAAGFAALFVHTLGYGSFLADPLTWGLLGAGAALAASARGT